MAEGTGVVNSPPRTPATNDPKNFLKKNRTLVIVAGGVGAVILLSKRGSAAGSAASTPQQQLAVSPGYAADPYATGGGGGGFSDGSGGGGGSFGGSNGSNAPTPLTPDPTSPQAGPTNTPTTINDGGSTVLSTGASDALAGVAAGVGVYTAGAAAHPAVIQPPASPPPNGGGVYHPPAPPKSPKGGGRPAPVRKPAAPKKPPAKPKTPAKGKPAPANKQGKHPATPHKTPHGNRKHSPAQVESMRGVGSGQMIMGREFPGAISHRMGAPRRNVDGTMTRTVTLDYGGRTEVHLVHNNGERWTDRAPGHNPPSRGVAVNTDPIPV